MKRKLRRHRHNLSNYQIGTCNPGEIIPVMCAPVCPGDSFQHRMTGLTRFLPMNAPVMHRVHVYYYSFFIPTRLLMDPLEWEDFITRSDDGISVPSMTLGDIKANAACARLADYLGLNTLPVTAASATTVNPFALRCYNAVYNEWFRDKDLVQPLNVVSSAVADFAVRKAAWRKDNYTSARPWPQLGTEVTIPLGNVTVDEVWRVTGGGSIPQDLGAPRAPNTAGGLATTNNATNVGDVEFRGAVDAPLSIRDLRRYWNLQALAERLGQFGHDYPSLLASMGVKSSDARLQRPEYLGGGKAPISFSEVLRTGDDATGEMFGHGIAPGSAPSYRRFFEEYGYVLSVMVVRPEPVYDSVIPRHWFHGLVDGANDFYTPELENIGQQEIYNKEIYPTDPTGGDNDIWGYGNKYQELRGIPSQVHGLFRGTQVLSYWTWARKFLALPALNQTFIECTPDTNIFQETTGQNIIFGVNNHLIAQRMLTKNTLGSRI